jgi:hypothetical protein
VPPTLQLSCFNSATLGLYKRSSPFSSARGRCSRPEPIWYYNHNKKFPSNGCSAIDVRLLETRTAFPSFFCELRSSGKARNFCRVGPKQASAPSYSKTVPSIYWHCPTPSQPRFFCPALWLAGFRTLPLSRVANLCPIWHRPSIGTNAITDQLRHHFAVGR